MIVLTNIFHLLYFFFSRAALMHVTSPCEGIKKWCHHLGRGGGQVASVLAFYSVNLSSNPAEAYSFLYNLCLKRMNINKKKPGFAHFLKELLPLRLSPPVNCIKNVIEGT